MPAEHDERGKNTQKPGEDQAKPAKVKRKPDFENSTHGEADSLQPTVPTQPPTKKPAHGGP